MTARGARILTLGVDQTVTPPQPLVRIVDERGARRGDLVDARAFLDDLERDFPPARPTDER
jgi:hypothetical protein